MTERTDPPAEIELLGVSTPIIQHSGWYEYRVTRGFFTALVQVTRMRPNTTNIIWRLKWRRDPGDEEDGRNLVTGYGLTEAHAAQEVTQAAKKIWGEMIELGDL